MESIALIPVWSGSFTGWRWTTPGALNSSGRRSSVSIGPCPSSGLPSGSTTRPSSAGPTGTDATLPVRRTGSPSLIRFQSPNRATPTLSSSRLNAIPTTPWSSSRSSRATQFSSPCTRAMPSPSWSTVPTSARSVSTSNSSIRRRRIDVISSGRSFIPGSAPCRRELLAETLEPAAHARVEPHRSGLEDDPPDQVRVDPPRRAHLAAGRLLDPAENPLELHLQDALCRRHERLELGGDLAHLPSAALLDQEPQEVADELVGSAEHLVEHVRLHVRLDLGVLEQHGQLLDGVERGDQVLEVGPHGVEAALLPGGVEERPRVDAVRDGYRPLTSSTEKSISASASSISRRWSASVSAFRVIFSAARSESEATSRRISPSACWVACSICRRVSSRRRCRSSSISPRIRSRWASATLRASARICSASLFARPISARCSSSSLCASSRARSASSSDWRIRSRRASMYAWTGPNAYFFSTTRVIANATSVQIIRPGVTWISGFAATSIG